MNAFDAEIELAIYHAFLRLSTDRLPKAPFMLNAWTRINDDRWFELLKTEIQAAIAHLEGNCKTPQVRQRSGALLAVLQQLKPRIGAKGVAA